LKAIRRSPKPHLIHKPLFLQPHILKLKKSFTPLDTATVKENRKVVRAQTRNALFFPMNNNNL